MQKEQVSEQELRNYFVQTLHEMVEDNEVETQVANIENKLYEKAFDTQNNTAFHPPKFEFSVGVLIRKWIWALMVQGKIIPGIADERQLPFLTITPEGVEWIKSEFNNEDSFLRQQVSI